MSKRACGRSFPPASQCPPILNTHAPCQLFIKICRTCFNGRLLVARIAILRQGGQLALLVMTGEASGVSQWSRLKGSLLQPESIADIFRRLGNEFIIRFFLWLLRFMTILTTRISVLVMWKKHAEIWNKPSALCRRKERFTKTRKRIPRRLSRSRSHMAVGTDTWNWPLTREELLPVTAQARLMLGILSHIRKGLITFAHLLPVLRRKCVA